MTLEEAIRKTDNLKPNMFPVEQKIEWLSWLDQKVYREIFKTHEYNAGETEITFDGYGPDDLETDLLVGEPYCEMYIHRLASQIDYHNMEYDGFNAANAMFESVYKDFRNDYNEEHMPLGVRKKYF